MSANSSRLNINKIFYKSFLYNFWLSIKFFIYADRANDDNLLTILPSLIWEWRAAIIAFVVVFIIIRIFETIKRKSKKNKK